MTASNPIVSHHFLTQMKLNFTLQLCIEYRNTNQKVLQTINLMAISLFLIQNLPLLTFLLERSIQWSSKTWKKSLTTRCHDFRCWMVPHSENVPCPQRTIKRDNLLKLPNGKKVHARVGKALEAMFFFLSESHKCSLIFPSGSWILFLQPIIVWKGPFSFLQHLNCMEGLFVLPCRTI